MNVPIRLELPTEFEVGTVNAWLFLEPEPILVDSGVPTEPSWQALTAGLAAHNLTAADLQRVIITHPHVDHFGQARRITEAGPAQVWIADLGVDWLLYPQAKWQERIDYYRDVFLPQVGLPPEMQTLVLGFFQHMQATSVPVAAERLTTFRVGDALPLGGLDWQVLHMPGHASEMTCFYQPETHQFFSADMLLPRTPTPVVERPSDGKTRAPSLPIYMESLARVEALEIEVVYPGHGRAFGQHRELIQRQRQRIRQRMEDVYQLIAEGQHYIMEIVNTLYANRPLEARFAGMWMLLGYLDLLQAEGRVDYTLKDGLLYYFVIPVDGGAAQDKQ